MTFSCHVGANFLLYRLFSEATCHKIAKMCIVGSSLSVIAIRQMRYVFVASSEAVGQAVEQLSHLTGEVASGEL